MNSHSLNVGAQCRDRARKRWGVAWRMLSAEQQENAIAKEVVSVLLAQPTSGSNFEPDSVLQHCIDVARAAIYEVST